MAAPALTPAEESALAAAVASIAAAQAARAKPAQVVAGDDEALVALGVPEAIVAAAGPAGFVAAVHEYKGPQGRGWTLIVRLDRDGQRWEFAHHVGPETARDESNGWALAPLPIGGA